MKLSKNIINSSITIACGLAAIIAVNFKYQDDIRLLQREYQNEHHAETTRIADEINNGMRQFYQGLRTIARMSGVRKIGHSADSLDETTRQSIQEVYNNLAINIDLSEVYIVPLELDPDKIDPRTGKLYEPITTFDSLIVGKTADDTAGGTSPEGVEEIEIHEYRLMKQQLNWLRATAPFEKDIKGLQYPALLGKEVITCDNRQYSTVDPNDDDRSGLVYSVPFYSNSGELKGSVSGVILTNVIRSWLPDGHHVLRNASYDYTVAPSWSGAWSTSTEWVDKVKADPGLIYSEVVPITITDEGQSWFIWAGASNDTFWSLPAVEAHKKFSYSAYLAIIIFVIGLVIYLRQQEKTHKLITEKNDELELRVLERTSEIRAQQEKLQDINDQLVEATQHKSDFLARMSHELRTPLNAIIGYSEMLLEDAEDLGEESFVDDLNKIQSAGKHLLALINDILDLTKIEAGKVELFPELINLKSVVSDIEQTIRPLMRAQSNTFSIKIPNDIGNIRTDLTKFRQIMFNLLSNACKFTENGQISLEICQSEKEDKDWFTFRVKDTGIGMTEEQLEKLFTDFAQADVSTTRKYGGTGLGLAISKRFAHMMGGNLTANSKKNSGSTFYLMLPAEMEIFEQQSTLAAKLAQVDKSDPEACQVLVIDDDPTVHDLMNRYLAKEGFNIITASNGKEGLQLAKEIHPDAITLDVMMPGMDGWSVLTKLKADAKLADIPVIMITILDDENMGYTLGASDYLTKPISRKDLKTIMKRHCRGLSCRPVLIVEDDADTRKLMRSMLAAEGLNTAEAENGLEAIKYLETTIPQLIILDLMMPVMDGFHFIEELNKREEWRDIPVIIATAKDLTAADRERLNGIVQATLEKGSFSKNDLMRILNKVLKTNTRHGSPAKNSEASNEKESTPLPLN